MTVAPTDDRIQWLLWRRQGVGASDVAGILGIGRWSSPWSVWADKVGLLPLDDEDAASDEMTAGRWLELAIGPWFAHETGLHVRGQQSTFVHPSDPIARCTLDGKVYEDAEADEPLGGLEIKTDVFGKPWDEIPAYYQAQAQWQMYVTGLQRTWFAVFRGRRIERYVLERDDDDIALIVDRVHRFWHDHVVAGVPPETDGSDATLEAIKAVYPSHVAGKSVDLDDLVFDLGAWRDAKAAKKSAEDEMKKRQAAITAALGEAEEGLVRGERVVTWRQQPGKKELRCDACDHVVVPEGKPFRVLRDAAKKEKTA